jgi:polygalacturonase
VFWEESSQNSVHEWDSGVAMNNTKAFNMAINSAQPGDTVVVPDGKSFLFTGGILAKDKFDIVIDFAGSSHFLPDHDIWPIHTVPNSTLTNTVGFDPAITIFNCTGVTLTSSSLTRAKVKVNYQKNTVNLVQSYKYFGGIINGNGKTWWDDVIKGKHEDHRPRLLHVMESGDMLIENLTLLNSPFWTLTVEAIDSEIRYVNVLVDRKYQSDDPPDQDSLLDIARRLDSLDIPFPIDDLPDWIGRKFRQPQDLNTDGIDPIGQNIWVHDCIIQNADDSVAVKPSHGGRGPSRIGDCTRNITVESMVLTGFGASIGSVAPHDFHRCLDNVTFRNITMPGTGKGKLTLFL